MFMFFMIKMCFILILLGGEESESSSSSSGSESDIEKDEKISSVLFMQVRIKS